MSIKLIKRFRARINQSRAWNEGLGALSVGLGLGVGVGAIVAAPVFGWRLDSGASSVLASAAGAAIGAGAATFFAQRALSRGDREACETIVSVLEDPLDELDMFREVIDQEKVIRTEVLLAVLHSINRSAALAIERMELLTSLHMQMRNGKGVAIADALIGLKSLKKAAGRQFPEFNLDTSIDWSKTAFLDLKPGYGLLLKVCRALGRPRLSLREELTYFFEVQRIEISRD